MQIPLVLSHSRLWDKAVDWIIKQAKKTPYSHITENSCVEEEDLVYVKPESIYMQRYWLFGLDYDSWFAKLTGLSVRLHWIRRRDQDRHLHDHPWTFWSLVLRGHYDERMPFYPLEYSTKPYMAGNFDKSPYTQEYCQLIERMQGSVEYRDLQDRHTISFVSPGGVWTLFIAGKKRQMWGFWCSINDWRCKVYHRDYAKFREQGRPDASGGSSSKGGVSFI